MDVSDLGEFGLIERIRAALPAAPSDRLIVGIGDDAAVWRAGSGCTIATTDTMVAGIHFLPGAVQWRDVGWKALATNISDIAAMGGVPAFALVTLGFESAPKRTVSSLPAATSCLRPCSRSPSPSSATLMWTPPAHHCSSAEMQRRQVMLSRLRVRWVARQPVSAR
jgi:thiamine-monophosphate kinase